MDASADSKTYKLMASTHISSNQNGGWLKTGIVVKPAQKVNEEQVTDNPNDDIELF